MFEFGINSCPVILEHEVCKGNCRRRLINTEILFYRKGMMMRNKVVFFGLVVTLCFCQALFAQIVEKWVAEYNGTGNDFDAARAIGTDASDNVYVAGFSRNASGNYDCVTIKYDTDGVEQWVRVYNGLSGGTDSGLALAVDDPGNVYVTGKSWNVNGNDYVTIMYDTGGTQQWIATYDGTGSGDDQAIAIALDGLGNAYVTGQAGNAGTYNDYVTIKYDLAGTEQWAAVHNGTGNGDDAAYDIAVDGSGNPIVTGTSTNVAGNPDYVTIKYDTTDGSISWLQVYDGTGGGYDQARAIALDPDGNAYVTGFSWNGGNEDYVTIKYAAADGAPAWTNVYNAAADDQDAAYDIAVDDSGNAYVTGFSKNLGGTFEAVTFKYETDGTLDWTQIYDSMMAQSFFISVDGIGNACVTGTVNEGGNYNYVTIRYDKVGGHAAWTKIYDGASSFIDESKAIAIEPDGSVYVTGYSFVGTNFNYATIKYAPKEETPIELISFEAESLDDAVLLSWETATEMDNAGFFLWRMKFEAGDYFKITSELIPAEGNQFTGASYEFVDGDVEEGATYYYKLEDVDYYGNSSFHGPIEITIETEEPQFGCGRF